MEYGILVVSTEDGECWQIIGSVSSVNEAREMAKNYNWEAHPDSEDTLCPPEIFTIMRRKNGYYTIREEVTL